MKMIYEKVPPECPIRQGDIFVMLPQPILPDPKNITCISQEDGNIYATTWDSVAGQPKKLIAMPVVTSMGIVATQNCDAFRKPLITFFKVDQYDSVSKEALNANVVKRIKFLTQSSRLRLAWLYLPKDSSCGFDQKMAVSFLEPFQVHRSFLEPQISLYRKCRLTKVAYEHYRERIAQFYRRYPYNEWYPLDRDEFKAYKEEYPEAEAYSWQE